MILPMANHSPLVSVIIPTRNRKELLLYALRSVIQQTYQNLQIIVHDNNSNDGTFAYLSERIHDVRIEYYHADHDLVMTENWNTAFRYVKGEYVVRLDDDNIFLKDFLEVALREMKRHSLDAISFSPLIVHLNNRVFPLFNLQDHTYVLDKFQSFYLEYRSLTDSNYTLYRTALIRKLFPDGNVYQGSLPDRYMNYSIADQMDTLGLRIGVNPKIMGVTRFDYRDSYPPDFELRFVDYTAITQDSIKKEMNVHSNFAVHRVITVQEFFATSRDPQLRRFFEQRLTSFRRLLTVMRIGHIMRITSTYTLQEYIVYLRYVLLILGSLFRTPTAPLEGEASLSHAVTTLKKLFFVTLASLRNTITRPQSRQQVADPALGDTIVKDCLESRTDRTRFSLSGTYGDLGHLLRQVRPPIH